MIQNELNASHILQAIDKIGKEEYPPQNESQFYDVSFKGKLYPLKMLFSYAHGFADSQGENLGTDKFRSNSNLHKAFTDLGFPIVWNLNKNPKVCITIDDCLFLNAISRKPYSKHNPLNQNQGNYLNKGIWHKTQLWANKIAAAGSFTAVGKISWLERTNKKEANQRFRHYSWYQLHYKDYNYENIFYTVGFETRGKDDAQYVVPVIKLDCKRKVLSKQQQSKFDAILKKHNVVWNEIKIPENERFVSWETVIEESNKFIERTLSVYKEAVDLLKEASIEMAAKIAWNSKSWKLPSGREGKSTDIHSNEHKLGFCPDEWLFDTEKTIDGYHYARIEPLHTKKGKHVDKIINLTLFTNDSENKQWYWVGRITNTEVIDKEQSALIDEVYRENGWIDEQITQLKSQRDIDSNLWLEWDPKDRFNLRFRTDQYSFDVKPFEDNELPPSKHYNLPPLEENPYSKKDLTHLHESLTDCLVYGNSIDKTSNGKKIKRVYQAKVSELDNLHEDVKQGYATLLRKEFPDSEVYSETFKPINNTRIDIVQVLTDKSHIFYEVKTYPNVMTSIRAALGQLLEYSYYPQQRLTDKFVIVSHLPASLLEIQYLEHISMVLGVHFSYVHFKLSDKKLGIGVKIDTMYPME